jgi:hypothetical protein
LTIPFKYGRKGNVAGRRKRNDKLKTKDRRSHKRGCKWEGGGGKELTLQKPLLSLLLTSAARYKSEPEKGANRNVMSGCTQQGIGSKVGH